MQRLWSGNYSAGQKNKVFQTENVQASKQINFLLVRRPFSPTHCPARRSQRFTIVARDNWSANYTPALLVSLSCEASLSSSLAPACPARWYKILIPALTRRRERYNCSTSSSSCGGMEWKVFAHWRDKKRRNIRRSHGGDERRDASSEQHAANNYHRTTWRFYFF